MKEIIIKKIEELILDIPELEPFPGSRASLDDYKKWGYNKALQEIKEFILSL